MADNSVFRPDTSGLTQFAAALLFAQKAALDACWKELRRWGQEFRRRVVRVTPVGPKDGGTARQGWSVTNERTAREMSVTVGTNVPYVVFLEYGTSRIAKGKVMAWREGDRPVMSWPAKSAGLPDFGRTTDKGAAGRFGTKRYERSVKLLDRAFTAGQGEQMPMLRPIGYEIGPQVLESMREAMRRGFDDGMAKRMK